MGIYGVRKPKCKLPHLAVNTDEADSAEGESFE